MQEDIHAGFTPEGRYLERDGRAARVHGAREYAPMKLCFVATDQAFLIALLRELSERDDCFYVKYSVVAKDGMFLGRCFMTTEEAVGRLWGAYKGHPKLMCTVQDDRFTGPFRAGSGPSGGGAPR